MRPKRDGTQYTIEVVVAVDKGVMDCYGGEIWDVVMASMAQTSDIYENSNLKQSISVSLVDLIQLPFDPSEGNLNENGGMCQIIQINFQKKAFHLSNQFMVQTKMPKKCLPNFATT